MNRHERKKALQNSINEVSHSGMRSDGGIFIAAAAARIIYDVLDTKLSIRGSRAAVKSYAIFDKTIESSAGKFKLECERGCNYCCHTYVSASPIEILAIARHLIDNKIDDVSKIVSETNERTKGRDIDSRYETRDQCPLLMGGECSVYPVRPLACRCLVSTSRELCSKWVEAIPMPAINATTRGNVTLATTIALRLQGLDTSFYELIEGLNAVLSTPDAERRWLSGENIFSQVPKDDSGADHINEALEGQASEVLTALVLGKEPPPNRWM